MRKLEEIKTWEDLIYFISESYSGINLKKIAKEKIGMGEKSFFDIRNGKVPGENLARKLRGFLRENFNAEIIASNNINISVRKITNINGDKNRVKDVKTRYGNETPADEKQKNYLLNRVIDLEDEVRTLRGKKKRKG